MPQDLSVVGFDGIAESERSPYHLTTVRQPTEARVTHSFKSLTEACAGEIVRQTILLRGELGVRGPTSMPGGR